MTHLSLFEAAWPYNLPNLPGAPLVDPCDWLSCWRLSCVTDDTHEGHKQWSTGRIKFIYRFYFILWVMGPILKNPFEIVFLSFMNLLTNVLLLKKSWNMKNILNLLRISKCRVKLKSLSSQNFLSSCLALILFRSLLSLKPELWNKNISHKSPQSSPWAYFCKVHCSYINLSVIFKSTFS